MPYGVDYLLDIQRLAARYHVQIDYIVDVGANIGQSIGAFHKTWPKARCLAIEADPDTYAYLISTPVSRYAVYMNVALSDAPEKVELYRFGNNATCNSLIRDNKFATQVGINPVSILNVQCNTLDGVLQDLGVETVDFVKIDTEGYEWRILNGALETLSKRHVKFVFFEFNCITIQGISVTGALAPVAEILEQLGFSFVATYPELAIDGESYFSISNALFFRNPNFK